MQAEEVQKLKDRIEARREDVFRLGAQLEEIRGDRFRIRQVQQQLLDLIQQLDGSIERAERRRDQLTYSPPPAGSEE
jgi:chromosome segregation ATPase